MAKSVKVRVPQADGEIRIGHDGDAPITYKVTDSHVSVPEDYARTFLAHVAGSTLVGGDKAAEKLPEQSP